MKFSIQRENLLRALQFIIGVVDKKLGMSVLGNVLLVCRPDHLSLTTTDTEIELIARAQYQDFIQAGEITVPARKLLDICRNTTEQSLLEFNLELPQLKVKTGRGKFVLSTLPAEEFPALELDRPEHEFNIRAKDLRYLIDSTGFSMAQQDVRIYLNGICLELNSGQIRCVATDGHRLAICTISSQLTIDKHRVIIPRKAVSELARLLPTDDASIVTLIMMESALRISSDDFIFTTKLIDAQFPSYERVIPRGGERVLLMQRDDLKQTLALVSVLSNETFRGVRFQLEPGALKISANNPEQERADEVLSVDYALEPFEVGFNVTYLLDIFNHLPSGEVRLTFADGKNSLLIESLADENRAYVVMPMRL